MVYAIVNGALPQLAEAKLPLSQSSNSHSMKADSAYLLNDRVMNVIHSQQVINQESCMD